MIRLPASIGAACAVLCGVALAASPRVHHESDDNLLRGELDGVAVTTSGRLSHAPLLTRMSGGATAGRAAHVWSMATDATGTVYLGTGPDGSILKLSPGGRESVLFRVEEPMITALAILPDGDILAGTAPGGKIYRVTPAGSGSVWCETGARYVWSIAIAADGTVFAGTGENGRIYRIDARGEAHELFQIGEPHVMVLSADPGGDLLAGSAGRGAVYRVDRDGHALVLYEGDLPEVSGLVSLADGTIVASFLAPPAAGERRPAVRIQLPDEVDIGAVPDPARTLQDDEAPTLEGVIEGLDPRERPDGVAVRGRVVRINPDGAARVVWTSRTEAPFALGTGSRGQLFFGTGEPARLYSVGPDDDVARVAGLDEAQITAIRSWGTGLAVATSNPAGAYRIDRDRAEPGVYLSPVFDAGASARWGSISWHPRPDPSGVEIYTRTGNSAAPDATWSGWGPVQTGAGRGVIDNPDGRYLQWRLKLAAGSGAVSNVSFTYEPYNRPPVLSDVRSRNGTAATERFELAWSVADADGDPIVVEGRLGAADDDGAIAFRHEAPPHEVSWDVGELPEGRYELVVTASDAAGNPPGEALVDRRTMVVTVDRTPPVIEVVVRPDDIVEITIADSGSALTRVEAGIDDRTLHRLRPLDGVCDSENEQFRVQLGGASEPGRGGWWIRATDAAGNVATERP